jgi:hypothetical protein
MRSASVPISPKHSYGVFEMGDPGSRSERLGLARSYKSQRPTAWATGQKLERHTVHEEDRGRWCPEGDEPWVLAS